MHRSVCFLGILQIKRGTNVLTLSLKNTLLQWMCSFFKINHFLSLQVRGSKQISRVSNSVTPASELDFLFHDFFFFLWKKTDQFAALPNSTNLQFHQDQNGFENCLSHGQNLENQPTILQPLETQDLQLNTGIPNTENVEPIFPHCKVPHDKFSGKVYSRQQPAQVVQSSMLQQLISLLHFPIQPIFNFIRIKMVLKIVHLMGRIWKTNPLFYNLWKHKIYN